MKGYYGDNIKNITLLHGKNGAGKSTLLDLLGMRLDDRRRNSHRKENRRSYFLMYHLYDNYVKGLRSRGLLSLLLSLQKYQ